MLVAIKSTPITQRFVKTDFNFRTFPVTFSVFITLLWRLLVGLWISSTQTLISSRDEFRTEVVISKELLKNSEIQEPFYVCFKRIKIQL